MTDRSDWEGRVGRSWADEWRRTDRSFGVLTDRLVEVATREAFSFALDIAKRMCSASISAKTC